MKRDATKHPRFPWAGYEVRVEKAGFRTEEKTGISLVLGQRETVDLVLQVGDVRQTLKAEAVPTAVAITTEDVSGLVGERQVKELSLNGRSYHRLMTLNPEVVNYTSPASRRNRGLQLRCRQNVFGLRAQARGESLSLERSRVYQRLRDQQHARRSERPTPGRTYELLNIDQPSMTVSLSSQVTEIGVLPNFLIVVIVQVFDLRDWRL
jgi:hypothetical protein